jgi:hypothetical protein
MCEECNAKCVPNISREVELKRKIGIRKCIWLTVLRCVYVVRHARSGSPPTLRSCFEISLWTSMLSSQLFCVDKCYSAKVETLRLNDHVQRIIHIR